MKNEYHTSNPETICMHLHINIEYAACSTKGYCYKLLGDSFIVISSLLSSREKLFVLSHELGHAILHFSNSSYRIKHDKSIAKKIYEDEANFFANTLLTYTSTK